GRRLGISICEDIWNDRDFWKRRRYHHDPIEELVHAGADAIVNLSASPFAGAVVICDLDAAEAIAPSADVGVESEIWRALTLGTRDYMRKCGFSAAVLGLSGGIDSALTAAVAVEAIGAEHVLGVLMPSP